MAEDNTTMGLKEKESTVDRRYKRTNFWSTSPDETKDPL